MPRSIDKIALFINGINLHATATAIGFEIDCRLFLREFQSQDSLLLRALYYTPMPEKEDYSGARSPID